MPSSGKYIHAFKIQISIVFLDINVQNVSGVFIIVIPQLEIYPK